jgi:hypothetical protein
MSPKTPSPMIATLLILGGAVFGVLGVLHTIYTRSICATLDDLPLSILRLHTRWRIRLSGYREDARTCGELGLALTLATALACCWLQFWRSVGAARLCIHLAGKLQLFLGVSEFHGHPTLSPEGILADQPKSRKPALTAKDLRLLRRSPF